MIQDRRYSIQDSERLRDRPQPSVTDKANTRDAEFAADSAGGQAIESALGIESRVENKIALLQEQMLTIGLDIQSEQRRVGGNECSVVPLPWKG